MQRLHPSLAIMRSPMRLAVERDDLALTELDHVLHPTEEALLKPLDRQRRCEALVRTPSALPCSLHPDFFVLAQLGGAVLPRDHRTSNPARHFPKRTRTHSSDLHLSQTLQREPETLRMD